MRFLTIYTSAAMRSACFCNWETLLLQVKCTRNTNTQIHIFRKGTFTQLSFPLCSYSNLSGNYFKFRLNSLPGFSYAGRADSYQMTTWSMGEDYVTEYNGWFMEQQTQFLLGRYWAGTVTSMCLQKRAFVCSCFGFRKGV